VHHRLRRIEIKIEATDGNKSQRFSRKIMLIAIKAHWDCG
jgi:tetrahydromethanopterin S-methyltransferase subunit G